LVTLEENQPEIMSTRKLLPVFAAIEDRAEPLTTPIDNANTPFFEVHSIEWLEMHREILNNSRRVIHFEIIWITKGEGWFHIDTSSYKITDHTLFLVHPSRVQRIETTGNINGFVVSFNTNLMYQSAESPGSSFFRDIITTFSIGRVLKLTDATTEKVLTNLLSEMTAEFECHKSLRMEILSGLLKVYLIYLHRMSGPLQIDMGNTKKIELYNRFQTLVERSFLSKKQVADYASDLSVTPSYLTEVVKRVSGYSASFHIRQRKLLEAKRLALYSSANMKEVAYYLGFDDLSHFSKYFKSVAGITFSEFKKGTIQKIATAS
jgi:AraC-like DNA-binding protein